MGILGMLKTAEYNGFFDRGEVAYAIIKDRMCVFTYSRMIWNDTKGAKHATSTINALEQIVQAICEQEGLNQDDLVFYDLQTSRRYEKKSGQFEFDRIIFDKITTEPSWGRLLCPPKIIELFSEFIGPNPCQITPTGQPFQV